MFEYAAKAIKQLQSRVKFFGILVFGAKVFFWRYCKNIILVPCFQLFGPARTLLTPLNFHLNIKNMKPQGAKLHMNKPKCSGKYLYTDGF